MTTSLTTVTDQVCKDWIGRSRNSRLRDTRECLYIIAGINQLKTGEGKYYRSAYILWRKQSNYEKKSITTEYTFIAIHGDV